MRRREDGARFSLPGVSDFLYVVCTYFGGVGRYTVGFATEIRHGLFFGVWEVGGR